MTGRRPGGLRLALVTGALALSACSGPDRSRLVWSDEFSGRAASAPDPASWRTINGGDGWGNQELECYTSSRTNSVVDGHGYLVISARSDTGHRCADGHVNDYTSARLTSHGLRAFRYGTIEVRAKMPTGIGAWPAFWALGNDHSTVGWPRSGEIDVTEVIGTDGTVSHSSLHGPKSNGQPYSITSQFQAADDLSVAFHVYSATWTPGAIAFAVDGKTFFTVSKQAVRAEGDWVFDQRFYLLLNVAVGGTWPGPPSAGTRWPQQMVVDYVRVYQNG